MRGDFIKEMNLILDESDDYERIKIYLVLLSKIVKYGSE